MHQSALLVLTTLLSVTSYAQDSTSMGFTFNHLALSVTDVDSSVAFYKKVLNLQGITNRTKMDGIRWLSMGEDKELHLALTTTNFDDFVATLDAMHIVYSDWPGNPGSVNVRPDGIKQVFFQDPDGYWIEVNSVAQ